MRKKTPFLYMVVWSIIMIVLVACSEDAAQEDTAVPKLHIYQNSGIMTHHPEGSVPSALDRVREYIIDEVGIEPVSTIPPVGTEQERLNLILGSKDQKLDIFSGGWDVYALQKTIIPLNDLLDTHGKDILATVPEEAWASMKDKEGNIWGIPRLAPIMVHPVFVRQDWLDKLGLEMPQTIDDLEQVLYEFKTKDPNETGEEDTFLLTDLNGLKMSLLGGFTENGNSNWIDPVDNMIKPVELHAGFKDFVIRMNDWYEKGYIHQEAFTNFDPLELLRTNRVGASAIWYSRITINQPKIQSNFPEMDYQIARDISGPMGLAQTLSPAGTSGYMITSKSENPEAAMKFINWQFADIKNALTTLFGVPEEDWNWADEDEYFVELSNEDYVGEFVLSQGPFTETQYGVADPLLKMHHDYLGTELLDYSMVKYPIDYDIVYDREELLERVPNSGDIERLREEEIIKFITGTRSIDEYDDFIDEMNRAGLESWIEFVTEQYNAYKGN